MYIQINSKIVFVFMLAFALCYSDSLDVQEEELTKPIGQTIIGSGLLAGGIILSIPSIIYLSKTDFYNDYPDGLRTFSLIISFIPFAWIVSGSILTVNAGVKWKEYNQSKIPAQELSIIVYF